jgi:hypothetical protein
MTIYSNLLSADENHGGGSAGNSASRRPWQQQQQQREAALMASAGWMGVSRSDVLMGVNTLVASRLMSQVICIACCVVLRLKHPLHRRQEESLLQLVLCVRSSSAGDALA